jgi:hypothetical protein
VNHKPKFTEKSCELGPQKFGSRIISNFYSNNREPDRKNNGYFGISELYLEIFEKIFLNQMIKFQLN